MSSTDITSLARRAAAELVIREERHVGSRMAAYERVGQMAGTSASWLRKFIGRDPDVRPSLVVGFNLLQLYDRLVTHFEAEAQRERERAEALKREIDAALPGTLGMVEGDAGAQTPGTPAEKDERQTRAAALGR